MRRHGSCPICLGEAVLEVVPAEPDVTRCRCGRCGTFRVTAACLGRWSRRDHADLGVPGSAARNAASVWIRYHQTVLVGPRAVLVDRDAAWLGLGEKPPGVGRRHHWAVVHGPRRPQRSASLTA